MGFCVLGGAMCTCSFGMAPSTLMVTPEKKTVSSMPVATIMDHVPMKNVMPFGMCQSMANWLWQRRRLRHSEPNRCHAFR
ncbi:MAG: DUF4280 domain-containing protein [Pilosibacter sp.]